MPKKTNPAEIEKINQTEAEAQAVEGQITDEEAAKAMEVEQSTDADAQVSAEVTSIKEDNETAKELTKKATKKVTENSAKKIIRSKKYSEAKKLVEAGKQYPLGEAIELTKKTSVSAYDGSVELHLILTKKKSKGSTESSRGMFNLPHGTGKTRNIIILTEEKIEEIAKTKKIDFDVALASPDLMPKVAKIAKILGPKGKMPDPKSGTVTTDPEKTIQEINSGKAEYRIDGGGNIHQIVGKISWDSAKLLENIKAATSTMPKSRFAAIYLSASVGPSIAVDLSSI
ncbi:50S ribosomal protein L1 [Candidatus Berkelbacteria bacterium]|nr:50S ribosomal protein L1 [Candidatus Berkelbacteria bacterium]